MSGIENKMVESIPNNEKKDALLKLYLEKKKASNTRQEIPPLPTRENIPLSFGQERLWFLYRLEQKNPIYNRPVILRFRGKLKIAILEASINKIVDRHETLRTIFPEVNGVPVQRVQAPIEIELLIEDLIHYPENKRLAIAKKRVVMMANEPFDLETGPLVREKLYRLGLEDHILAFITHHIVFDAWSETLFVNEIAAYYEAFENQQPDGLPRLPIQYGDYAQWQRDQVKGEAYQNKLAYWVKQLKDVQVLELPLDQPRPASQSFEGGIYSFELPASLTRALKDFSKQEGITLFMTLLASFQVLLHRYTGKEDFVVGSPVAGRQQMDTEKLIGVFINTIAIRANLAGNPTFREYLLRTRKVILEALSYQDTPFEKVVEVTQPERMQDRHPLFQVLFNFENIPQPTEKVSNLKIERIEISLEGSQFDLSLEIIERNNKLIGTVRFNTDLFFPDTIQRISAHYRNLLEVILTKPKQKIGTLPLLSKIEQHQILVRWNNTHAEYPSNYCIHELFEKQVERIPDHLAVISPPDIGRKESEKFLTYRELNERANQLAHYLRKLGVGADDLVTICMERSLELIVGILGILKAGGAYVPLDPSYPEERLLTMVEDIGGKVIITQKNLAKIFFYKERPVICLDSDWGKILTENIENPVLNTTSGNLAYVIYSSGSTGMPKGIMIGHKSLVNYIWFGLNEYSINEGSNILQFSSISFDMSVAEIFSGLISGASLILRSEEMVYSISSFFEVCDKYQISHLKLPTPFWAQVSHALDGNQIRFPASLKWISAAGDRLKKEDILPWQKYRTNHPVLVNEYGPSETTGSTTYFILSVNDVFTSQPPIGRPIPNVQTYILDEHLCPLPVGAIGELYIGGSGVGRGYLNQPGLTAEKFIPNPFSTEPGSRFYKSGDLARYLSDGNIDFVGRIDQQVKIRGYRVELGEIESVLGNHEAIKQTIVQAFEHPSGGKYLVAYIILNYGHPADGNEFQKYLKQKLPGFMVPDKYVILDSFPMTPSGKINRLMFPTPKYTRPKLNSQVIAPRTPIEKTLVIIWTEVLGIPVIGVNDNFFELGGHSLMVTQVVSRINQQYPMSLTIRNIFDTPTIADLATVIEEQIKSAS
jgi:amino acid adenylation domain-containing protein